MEVLRLVEQELAQVPGQKVIEFEKKNFSVSLIEPEKKLLFAPISGGSASAIRPFINQLKEYGFKVTRVIPKEMGSFEVDLDKTEDFPLVVDYINTQRMEEP